MARGSTPQYPLINVKLWKKFGVVDSLERQTFIRVLW